MPRAQDLPGSYLARGAVIAHVLRSEDISVKVAVPQQDAGIIRSSTRAVAVSLADRPGEAMSAALTGEVPAATAILPTAALGDRSGGPVVTDPADTQGTRTLEPVFLFDVRRHGNAAAARGRTGLGAFRPRRQPAGHPVAAPPPAALPQAVQSAELRRTRR